MSDEDQTSSFGLCSLDASTGEFSLTAFDDDICRTRLETMFRQIRPKELLHAKVCCSRQRGTYLTLVQGNLSVHTQRLLRSILPSSTSWTPFKDGDEFYTAEDTLRHLGDLFQREADPIAAKPDLPDAVSHCIDKPLALEALGGMLFYLNTLNLDKDLISQNNFNIYDPMKEGRNLVLDGQTLGHMEVRSLLRESCQR